MPAMTSAPWNGMRIPGGRLLLVGDQGYGDTIQFARYIPMAAERCQEVILGCSAELAPLLDEHSRRRRNTAIAGPMCLATRRIAGCPACRICSARRLDTIPPQIPYLKADPARIAHWRERLDATLPARGEADRPGLDRAADASERPPAVHAAGAARAAGGCGPGGIRRRCRSRCRPATWRRWRGSRGMTDLADDLTDFGETAAVMENLDLVMTVDTSMGHLAGALGKPVWILIPKAADWRWMLDREDSPWYPSARLFRQQKPGAWDEPMGRLRGALGQYLAQGMEVAAAK